MMASPKSWLDQNHGKKKTTKYIKKQNNKTKGFMLMLKNKIRKKKLKSRYTNYSIISFLNLLISFLTTLKTFFLNLSDFLKI